MTTSELYNAILCKPDLHSRPRLYDDALIWHLYKTAYLRAACGNGDAVIEIFSGNGFTGSVMHWHPDEEDMIEELYTLGKKGNMLVLKKSLWGTSIFYSGPAESFPFPDRRTLYFGPKIGGDGKLIYLEQKEITAR